MSTFHPWRAPHRRRAHPQAHGTRLHSPRPLAKRDTHTRSPVQPPRRVPAETIRSAGTKRLRSDQADEPPWPEAAGCARSPAAGSSLRRPTGWWPSDATGSFPRQVVRA
eukprot:scaffold10720_cov69-Phaeocystis_antarctica.AAC.2